MVNDRLDQAFRTWRCFRLSLPLICGGLIMYLPEKQLEQNVVSGSDDIESMPSSDKYLSESTLRYDSIFSTLQLEAISSSRVGISIP